MFEFGGHTKLTGLSLLAIRNSLDGPIYFQRRFFTIGGIVVRILHHVVQLHDVCIFVPM